MMKAKPKRKPRTRTVKPSDYMKLYNAAVEYVETRGGSVVVIGGIQVMRHVLMKHNFYVVIKITGIPPTFVPE